MKKYNKNISKLGIASLALSGCLATAVAQEQVSEAYKGPRNTVGAGGAIVTKKSAKFGEYTGLNKSRIIGFFDLNGGDGLNLAGGTRLWNFTGTDLGTTSRALDAGYSDQGKWKVNVGYDQLKHYISDSYQTPFVQSGNSNTLPEIFSSINAKTPALGTNSLSAAQLASFKNEEVATHRKTLSFGSVYSISKNLELNMDYSHLDQSGNKLIGIGAMGVDSAVVGNQLPGGGAGVVTQGRAVSVLLNPTEYKTDNFGLGVNWFGENGSLKADYFGSIFKDKYTSVSWQNPITYGACTGGAACWWNNSMGTAPDNNFHQVSLTGAYHLAPKTKVTSNISYGINKQKDDYAPTTIAQTGGAVTQVMVDPLPATSLNGKVITTHGDVKLTHELFNRLSLSAGLIFNERKNKSPSKLYHFNDIGANGTNSKPSQVLAANTPYSNRKIQANIAGDFKITDAQKARLFYERENIKRWCIGQEEHGTTPCIVAPKTTENTIGTTYRLKATEDINVNLGYTYAHRKSNLESLYRTSLSEGGDNGQNKVGFAAVPFAGRVRNTAKTGVNWQTTDALDLGLSGSYTRDRYNQTFGIKNAYAGAINFDASYAINQNHSVSAYTSWQNAARNIYMGANGGQTTVPTQFFTNKLIDKGTTIGLASNHKGFLNGKMEVNFDASFSLDKTRYSTALLTNQTIAGQANTPTNCTDSNKLTCGDTPDIRSRVVTFKLNDSYAINENNVVGLEYMFQKRNSEDYFYNGYQYANTPATALPTNEQAPSYTDNLIAVNYSYRF